LKAQIEILQNKGGPQVLQRPQTNAQDSSNSDRLSV